MSTPVADALDKKVGEYLRTCGRPVDMDELLNQLASTGHSAFEIKESVWRLLDQHQAELTDTREIVFAVAGR